ncbi:hypothetical protein D9M69_588620 [compost metagenome]
MIGIARQAITDHFSINLCTTCQRMFQFFQNHNARALAHNETVAVTVIWTRCSGWIVIALGGQSLTGGKACQ